MMPLSPARASTNESTADSLSASHTETTVGHGRTERTFVVLSLTTVNVRAARLGVDGVYSMLVEHALNTKLSRTNVLYSSRRCPPLITNNVDGNLFSWRLLVPLRIAVIDLVVALGIFCLNDEVSLLSGNRLCSILTRHGHKVAVRVVCRAGRNHDGEWTSRYMQRMEKQRGGNDLLADGAGAPLKLYVCRSGLLPVFQINVVECILLEGNGRPLFVSALLYQGIYH